MTDDIVYKYSTFNKDNWNYNVDKVFLVVMLGLLWTTIRLMQLDFNVSTGELFLRLLIGPFNVLFLVTLIESISAVLTKIAFEPGIIIESKLMVIPKVFFKTMLESYLKTLKFKQVYFIKEIRITKNPYITLSGLGICGSYSGELQLTGYVKIPEHFKC